MYTIPPLHVTVSAINYLWFRRYAINLSLVLIPISFPFFHQVTLMSDKDPRRRCFHCVFTNSKGTNGSLGIITPELLASLFATPLRTSRRHQRKRSRGGTTRVGQSVSTSTANNKEQKHCVQHIVSTSEQHENPPSPLLMPPPGPPIEESSKKEDESKTVKIEMTDWGRGNTGNITHGESYTVDK